MSNTITEEQAADIAIVGGGPSGLTLAAICEQQGFSYVVFERGAKDTPPRGACLDLHAGSGQRAMKEAGVYDEFVKRSRSGNSTTLSIHDHHGTKRFTFGVGRDAPEIDREDIRQTLLSGIPQQKVQWKMELKEAKRDDNGQIVLYFKNGSISRGHKLVVGADGALSKIRPLVTPVDPKYTGLKMFSGTVRKENTFFQDLREKIGEGAHAVMGRSLAMWIQIQGSGDFLVSVGVREPIYFGMNGLVSYHDAANFKELLTSSAFFGQHAEFYKDAISAVDGTFYPWPLWEMPTEALSWAPSSDITLIGDAAHATTPFIGDGANCAMRDAIILVDKLKEHGFGKEAVGAYEEEMFALAKAMIEGSAASGKLFFEWDAPRGFTEMMEKNPVIGLTDEY